jgi:uncharacterized protein (TIGR02145 family)
MKSKLLKTFPRRRWSASVNTIRLFMLMALILPMMYSCGEDDGPVQIETGSVADIQGNIYKTVRIGNQWWMAENLKSTFFTNGELIPIIPDMVEWAATTAPAYCTYNNASDGFGLLYNFHVINSGKEIAPYGWHVPTDEDWKVLEEYIGMPVGELEAINWRGTNEGDRLKVENNNDTPSWATFEGVWGTNDFGFSADGGSCRVFNGDWGFPATGRSGYWWCSTASDEYGWFRYLDYQKSGIFRYAAHPNYGFSIRCVKN